jgi:hypothetical protein
MALEPTLGQILEAHLSLPLLKQSAIAKASYELVKKKKVLLGMT